MYTIYTVTDCPQAMLDKYPTPALYVEDSLYLFGETLGQVTGTPAEVIIDVAAYGFNHPYQPPYEDKEGNIVAVNGLTAEQLDGEVDRLLLLMDIGEVQLSDAQGKYLYETRFKPISTPLHI